MNTNDSPAAEERQPQDDEGRVDIGASLARAAASMAQSLEGLRRDAAEALQAPFDGDGRLDLDVVRSGNYDIREDAAVRAALIDEAEALRADKAAAAETITSIEQSYSAAAHRLSRARNSAAELRRLHHAGALSGVRAVAPLDALETALGGQPHISTLVMVEDDTVYVTDGVTQTVFTVSEAYSVMQELADGLPNGRRALGPVGTDVEPFPVLPIIEDPCDQAATVGMEATDSEGTKEVVWSCVQHADAVATDLEARRGEVPTRFQRVGRVPFDERCGQHQVRKGWVR